jgi:hypothetical protein
MVFAVVMKYKNDLMPYSQFGVMRISSGPCRSMDDQREDFRSCYFWSKGCLDRCGRLYISKYNKKIARTELE